MVTARCITYSALRSSVIPLRRGDRRCQHGGHSRSLHFGGCFDYWMLLCCSLVEVESSRHLSACVLVVSVDIKLWRLEAGWLGERQDIYLYDFSLPFSILASIHKSRHVSDRVWVQGYAEKEPEGKEKGPKPSPVPLPRRAGRHRHHHCHSSCSCSFCPPPPQRDYVPKEKKAEEGSRIRRDT